MGVAWSCAGRRPRESQRGRPGIVGAKAPSLGLGAGAADDVRPELVLAFDVGRELRRACKAEIALLKARGHDLSVLKSARRWLHRDEDKVPAAVRPQLAQVRAAHPGLDKMVTMREELRQLWTRTNVSAEQLVADLQAWCKKAEESGIAALQEFALKLRAVHA